MVNGRTSGVIRQIARVFQDGTLAGLSDREILGRFVDVRDEAAFEALLARHGPMVLNVCRQILRDPDDAEDAFQTTFLALACKAATLRIGESLGPWLYTVANRVAARARADRRRRADRERSSESIPEPEPDPGDNPDREEIPRVVHEELGRLPERLRAPIVLCYMEGMTHDRAALQLRCPVGTVRSRLARARALLHARIARRGLATSTVALGAVLASNARASSIPPPIPKSLVQIAAQLAVGTAPVNSCGVSARVAALLEGVLNVLRIEKLAGSMAGLAVAGIVVAIAGLSVFSASGQTGDPVEARKIGGDGGRVGADPHETYVKAYYIGDLLPADEKGMPRQVTKRSLDGVTIGSQRAIDMSPVVEIIASTIRPGTWTVNDGRGGAGAQTVGQITPFLLSYSLIIRHTDVARGEVADLLRKLRRLVHSRDNPEGVQGYDREVARVGLPAPSAPEKAAKAKTPSPTDRRARMRRLLDELRQEVEKLPQDHD
jgi:RNA polymerase sigma factor (sigma-70 family)